MSGAAQPHPPELWDACRALVVSDGLTLAAAAAQSGIPVSTVEKRAARKGWARLRREARDNARSYRSRIFRLKNQLLDAAIEDGDVQTVQTWQGVERAYPDRVYAGISETNKRQLVGVFSRSNVEYLKEHAPDLLALLADHVEGMARAALEADWEAAA